MQELDWMPSQGLFTQKYWLTLMFTQY